VTSNAVPPSVTPPSPDEWPQDLIKTITGITNNNRAVITVTDHGFISEDEGQTFLMFKQVQGMIQINGMNALIEEIIDDDSFSVNINSTSFYPYSSSGVAIVDSGLPPVQTSGFQTFNTPFQNIANQG
jgi:hypothetical protein